MNSFNFRGKSYKGWAAIGAVAVIIAIMVLEPLVVFWLGYFSGWLTKIIVGERLVTAMNASLGTHLNPDLLPYLGGSLAWIGSFFKNITNTAKKN